MMLTMLKCAVSNRLEINLQELHHTQHNLPENRTCLEIQVGLNSETRVIIRQVDATAFKRRFPYS